jgi:GNAT superfamily N-acetyltransferase
MIVVPAEDPHYLIIQHIAQFTWPDTFREILSDDQIDYMLKIMYSDTAIKNQITNLGHKFILVWEDGTYHGFASYEHNYKHTNMTKVHKLYILPKSQGKGAGKLLLDYIEELTQKEQNTGMTLNVNRNNEAAIVFYKHHGWTIDKEEDIDIGNNFMMNDFVMSKQV